MQPTLKQQAIQAEHYEPFPIIIINRSFWKKEIDFGKHSCDLCISRNIMDYFGCRETAEQVALFFMCKMCNWHFQRQGRHNVQPSDHYCKINPIQDPKCEMQAILYACDSTDVHNYIIYLKHSKQTLYFFSYFIFFPSSFVYNFVYSRFFLCLTGDF